VGPLRFTRKKLTRALYSYKKKKFLHLGVVKKTWGEQGEVLNKMLPPKNPKILTSQIWGRWGESKTPTKGERGEERCSGLLTEMAEGLPLH